MGDGYVYVQFRAESYSPAWESLRQQYGKNPFIKVPQSEYQAFSRRMQREGGYREVLTTTSPEFAAKATAWRGLEEDKPVSSTSLRIPMMAGAEALSQPPGEPYVARKYSYRGKTYTSAQDVQAAINARTARRVGMARGLSVSQQGIIPDEPGYTYLGHEDEYRVSGERVGLQAYYTTKELEYKKATGFQQQMVHKEDIVIRPPLSFFEKAERKVEKLVVTLPPRSSPRFLTAQRRMLMQTQVKWAGAKIEGARVKLSKVYSGDYMSRFQLRRLKVEKTIFENFPAISDTKKWRGYRGGEPSIGSKNIAAAIRSTSRLAPYFIPYLGTMLIASDVGYTGEKWLRGEKLGKFEIAIAIAGGTYLGFKGVKAGSRVVNFFSTKYVKAETAGVWVKGVTVKTPYGKLKSFENKPAAGAHLTLSTKWKGLKPGELLTVQTPPGGQSAKRLALYGRESQPLYVSMPSPSGKPYYYTGYIGLGGDYAEPAKVVFQWLPFRKGMVEVTKISKISTKGLTQQQIARTMAAQPGKKFIPAENILSAKNVIMRSTEGQFIITPGSQLRIITGEKFTYLPKTSNVKALDIVYKSRPGRFLLGDKVFLQGFEVMPSTLRIGYKGAKGGGKVITAKDVLIPSYAVSVITPSQPLRGISSLAGLRSGKVSSFRTSIKPSVSSISKSSKHKLFYSFSAASEGISGGSFPSVPSAPSEPSVFSGLDTISIPSITSVPSRPSGSSRPNKPSRPSFPTFEEPPPPFIKSFKSGLKEKGIGMIGMKTKPWFKYTPSLAGIGLGFVRKPGRWTKKAFTGMEIRPMLKIKGFKFNLRKLGI